MPSNQAIKIQLIDTQQDAADLAFTRMSTKKLNLFQVDQLFNNKQLNPRQMMIQRLKLQTQELRQLKRTISSVSVSRLNQMKKIVNQNAQLQGQQSQYRFERSNSGNYAFTKSIKDLVRMGRVNKQSQHDKNNGQTNKKIIKVNPEISPSNDCITLQKSRYLNKAHHQQSPQQQSPSLITTANKSQSRFFTKHMRRMSSESNHNTHSSKKPTILSRANSQNRLRSSSTASNFHKSNDQMTLAIRKQLYQMQAKQKLLQNKIKLRQNQMKHKLERKIKQNVQLQQKHKGLYEIIQTRMQRQREKANLTRRRIQQRRFIHQGKALKISIQKLSKKSQKKQQQQMIRNISQESVLNLAYTRYLKEKQDLEKQEKLAYRLSFAKDFYNKDLIGSRIACQRINCQRPRTVSTQYL